MMRHCFFPAHLGRSGSQTDTAEGIRALAVDKDNQPRWNPARIEDVSAQMVLPFFTQPLGQPLPPAAGLELTAPALQSW